ncbi:MAG: YXWGXW repeat-containing protein [Gemmatimonadota bacterium]
MKTHVKIFVLASLVAAMSAGCVAVTYVPIGPPTARIEVRTTKPGPKYTWAAGHWNWNGHDYVWVDGYWMKNKKGKTWAPGRWKKAPQGHVWVSGCWR